MAKSNEHWAITVRFHFLFFPIQRVNLDSVRILIIDGKKIRTWLITSKPHDIGELNHSLQTSAPQS